MAKPLELIFAKHDRLDEIAFAEQRKLPGEVGKTMELDRNRTSRDVPQ